MSRNQKKTPIQTIRSEYYRTDKKCILFIPILLVFLGIFTRWVCGSPLSTLHYISAREIVPPTWLMILLFSVSYAVAGFALGSALGNPFCSCGERKYQGAMWFVLALGLGYIWYPIFFCARLFLVSVLICLLCLFSSLCATVCFASVSKISFYLSLAYDLWLLYLMFLNLQIFFAI